MILQQTRGALSSGDQLALDLQFAADKTLTARRGPTPVLTRGSTGTFVGSNGLIQTAAVNAARFDHNPANPTICRGLLIEEGRMNLILQSENFAIASWVKSGGVISSIANVEPDGSVNSELFTEDTSTATHRTFQSFTATSGTVYTLSVFLKFAGRQYVFLENRSITTNPYVVFDIQNGSVFSTVGTLTSTIQAYPNGWYRCSVTGTANLAGGNYLIGGYSGGSQSYTGLGGSAFYAWGAQVEAGSFATSYIPTTTSALARSADVCSLPNINFFNSLEGTILGVAYILNPGTTVAPEIIRFGTATDRVQLGMTNGSGESARPLVVTNNISQFSGQTGTSLAGVRRSSIFAYATNNCRAAHNGTLGTLDSSVTLPTGISASSMFSATTGTIESIRYYRKRLVDSKLQALTA